MRVTVNGRPIEIDGGTTVADLLDRLDLDRRGVAVALNEEVVPRARWGATTLGAGARVEVLRAAQGG